MKKRVFNLIILDESGSMSAIERQAVSGLNETLQTIRHEAAAHADQEHFATLVTFNSDAVTTLFDRIPASETRDIRPEQYQPSACTPLYDAMGRSITALRRYVAEADVVLVTVITDGEENSSREYTGAAIRHLVESLKTRGWVFTYIGANQDVERVAKAMAINNSLAFEADAEGTKAMFERDSASRRRLFDKLSACECFSSQEADGNYF